MIATTPPPRKEDYMPGGQSGMAGVGRRAFQAVAHAALLTQHWQTSMGIEPRYLNTNVGVSGTGRSYSSL